MAPQLAAFFKRWHLSRPHNSLMPIHRSSEEDPVPHPGIRWHPDPNNGWERKLSYDKGSKESAERLRLGLGVPESGFEEKEITWAEELERAKTGLREVNTSNKSETEEVSMPTTLRRNQGHDASNAKITSHRYQRAGTSCVRAATTRELQSVQATTSADAGGLENIETISPNSDGPSDISPDLGLKKVAISLKGDLRRHMRLSGKEIHEKTIPEDSTLNTLSPMDILLGASADLTGVTHYKGNIPTDIETLLNLSDMARLIIGSGFDMHNDDVANLRMLLKQWIEDESMRTYEVPLLTIIDARLDKLTAALCEMKTSIQCESDPDFKDLVSKAILLRRIWLRKHEARFADIETIRSKNFTQGGRFTNIMLDPNSRTIKPTWRVGISHGSVGEAEEEMPLRVGEWWINHVCAYRDGAVTAPDIAFAKDRLGHVTNISLLQGTEVDGILPNETIFAVEGALKEIGGNLLSQVGKQVRLLRGYRLMSKYAPKAGIRYDGVYKIQQFGLKYDIKKECHRVELRLHRPEFNRLDSQLNMKDIMDIPSASQLDDWKIFQTIEDEVVRSLQASEVYQAWKAQEMKEEQRRASFHSRATLQDLAYESVFEEPKLPGI